MSDVSRPDQGSLVGGAWEQLNVARAWSVVMRAALAAFYSHPWAWNEIGFGGPAYPRGFMRLGGSGANGAGVREPFEKPSVFENPAFENPATDRNPVRPVAGERD